MVILGLLGLLCVAQGQAPMTAGSASGVEGRPSREAASPLQERIDAASPGGTIEVGPGTYAGDLYIDRAVRVIGHGRPRLVASGQGSVVRVRAAGVVFEGFDIDGRLAGSLAADSSGVHVAAHDVIVRDLRIERTYFGIYLYEADGATVDRVVVRGVPGMDPGEQGSGLHVYNTQGFRLVNNDLAHVRDGIYIQSSNRGTIQGNVTRELRYGLHYMFSDDNTFEDNRFEDGAAGAALMYSKRLTFRRNRFLHNRGFASAGLLLKDCEDVIAEDNLIADNARGVFLEGSDRNTFQRNLVAVSDVGLVLFDSSHANVFRDNAFVANLSPLELVGRRSDTNFDGNFWSGADAPDLDGDGVRDRPYRITSLFDHFRGNVRAANLFAQGPASRALAMAERTFPVLAPVSVQDRRPLARLPWLGAVPAVSTGAERHVTAGLIFAAATLAMGLGVFQWGRRRTGTKVAA